MSEQLTKKKKKNKKKKSPPTNQDPPVPAPPTESCDKPADNKQFSINVLPQKVGLKTIINDLEVTLTSVGNTNGVTASSTAKKKKKKKKKLQQQQPPDTPTESVTALSDSFEKLITYKDDRIELVNHPEISVTLSTVPTAEELKSSDKGEREPEKAEVVDPGTTKKKKKKKKKKTTNGNVNGNALPVDKVGNKAPVKSEELSDAPTCVKLPADGNNLVLLVSHENFSNRPESTPASNPFQNSSGTVLIKRKDSIDFDQTPLQPEYNLNSYVTIMPVTNKVDEKPSDAPASQKVANGDVATPEANASNEGEVKTKAQLKAERRAKQEAQRAAKAIKNVEKASAPTKDLKVKKVAPVPEPSVTQPAETLPAKIPAKAEIEISRKAQVFSHLPQFRDFLKQQSDKHFNVHPAILELGYSYSKGILCGSNARCVGFLAAFREVIQDCKTAAGKTLSRDLEGKLQTSLTFLNNCRPLSVSILNAVKVLKQQINLIPEGESETSAKKILYDTIENFINDDVLLAMEAISIFAAEKIVDGDTILVFAYSSVVRDALCKAHDQKKEFHVIVVDSRPKLEGQEMLRRLVKHGLSCSYALIGAVSYVMRKVSKVMIGAHALLSNGCVMSRLGCKQLALVASTFSIPVLVCCETYKFWERALTDSFVHNELGDPEDLVSAVSCKNESLSSWKDLPLLQIYNILYDVTPSDLISVVITEKGLLPCTSVPVVLRVKHAGSRTSGAN